MRLKEAQIFRSAAVLGAGTSAGFGAQRIARTPFAVPQCEPRENTIGKGIVAVSRFCSLFHDRNFRDGSSRFG